MQLSFRDPDGFVFRSGDRIFRCVFPHAVADLRSFLSSELAATWMPNGTLPDTTVLTSASGADLPSEVQQKTIRTLPELAGGFTARWTSDKPHSVHPKVLATLEAYAKVLQKLNRPEEAAKIRIKAKTSFAGENTR